MSTEEKLEQRDESLSNKDDDKTTSTTMVSKEPPPESPDSIRVRALVIAAFWVVVIFLGLPLWLWTTSIHREHLPLQDMLDWADGKACRPTFPLRIAIEAPFLHEIEAVHLVRITQHALDDLNEFSAHHLRLRLSQSSSSSTLNNISTPAVEGSNLEERYTPQHRSREGELEEALTIKLHPQDGAQSARAELNAHSTVLDIHYASSQVASMSSSSSSLATFIASQLQDLFAEEQASIAYILTSSQSTSTSHQSAGSSSQSSQQISSGSRDIRPRTNKSPNTEISTKLASRLTRSLKHAPTYHITFSLFTPSDSPSSWDIELALAEYFAPLLESISAISKFTVDTQVQLYAAFSPSVQSPEYDELNGLWTLREEDLSGFINAAEWPLSPSVGAGPTLNFVIYVPDQTKSPLVVKGSQASSWLIPQWGGVVILNSSGTDVMTNQSTLSKNSIQPAMLTFSHQLLSFLGAPHSPASLPLQLQTLTRIRAASLLLSASSTMGSLARLTVALPSIAIPETVSTAVGTTLLHLRRTCDALRDGRFADGLENARVAEAEAEKGFFEKSMVGQVYFPDEHKVAVYLPLLGPIGVPLVMTALKDLKRLWASWKANRSGP